jgi:hypothetical protein
MPQHPQTETHCNKNTFKQFYPKRHVEWNHLSNNRVKNTRLVIPAEASSLILTFSFNAFTKTGNKATKFSGCGEVGSYGVEPGQFPTGGKCDSRMSPRAALP